MRFVALLLAFATASISAARDHLALLGTYTGAESRGLYAVRLDAETGRLNEPELVAELPNPEFLAAHPNGRVVYALTQVKNAAGGNTGAVAAFEVDRASGKLTPLNTVSTGRGSLTHLAVDATARMLVAASYGGGYVVSFPLQSDGRLGGPATLLSHEGPPGPNRSRQEKPHPHNVTLSPDNRFAWVADLGLDRVLAYALSPADASLAPHEPAFLALHPGAGPRHTAFSADGTSFYVLNELDGTITACRYDAARGTAEAFQRISTSPDDYTGRNSGSEIRIHPSGRFVYAANRGHNGLAVFAREPATGALERIEIVPCGGDTPRNFALSPDGAWLLCGHQNSNTLSAFQVHPDTGRLTLEATTAAPKPVCVLFLR